MEFVEELPKTVSGKIKRNDIRRADKAKFEEPVSGPIKSKSPGLDFIFPVPGILPSSRPVSVQLHISPLSISHPAEGPAEGGLGNFIPEFPQPMDAAKFYIPLCQSVKQVVDPVLGNGRLRLLALT